MKKIFKTLAFSMLLINFISIKAFAITDEVPKDDYKGSTTPVPPKDENTNGGSSKKTITVYENTYENPKHIYVNSDFNKVSKRGTTEISSYDKDGNEIITIAYYIKHYVTKKWEETYTKDVVVDKKEIDVAYRLDITGPVGVGNTTYSKTQQAYSPSNADGFGGNSKGKYIASANKFTVMEGNPAPGKYLGKGYGYRHYYSSIRTDTYTQYSTTYTNGYTSSYSVLTKKGTAQVTNNYEWKLRFSKEYLVGEGSTLEEILSDEDIKVNPVIIK